MTAMAELPRLERYLYATMTADGTVAGIVGTRVFAGQIPQSVSTWPCVLYAPLSSGEDVPGPGPVRIWTRPLYVIRAVSPTASAASLQTLADRIDALFNGTKGTSSDLTIHSARRERGRRDWSVEGPDNALYSYLGGEYRFEVSPTVNP